MTDTATNTEGAPDSSTAAQAAGAANAAPADNAAQQQQVTDGSNSAESTNPDSKEQPNGEQASNKAEQPQAPEKYEFKAPEGVQLDDTTMEKFSEVAKELNMPQEAAQKMLETMGPLMAQRQAEMIETVKTDWGNQSKADKEFGGQKLTENLAVAEKALKAFGTPELRELLNQSGLGNHPEIIRAFYRAGKSISVDSFVPGGVGGPAGSKDMSKALYPNQS
jgi:hypothetical protein